MPVTTQKLLTKADLDAALKKEADPTTRSAKPYSIPAGGVPGLAVQIFPGNATRATYSLYYRAAGKARRYKVGYFPTTPIAEARKRTQKLLNKIADGGDPQGDRIAARTATVDTVEAVAKQFVQKHCIAKGRRDWRQTERILQKHFVAKFGKRALAEIKRREIADLLDDIAVKKGKREGGPIAANRTLAAIRKLFNWALNREIIETTPCTRMDRPGEETRRQRKLSDDELRAVWNAAEQVGGAFGAIVQLLMLTATRRGEVGGMRRREIDVDAKVWTVPPERTKNKLPHEVPLSNTALAIIEQRLQEIGDDPDDDFLFPGQRKGKALNCYSQLKEDIDAAAGSTSWKQGWWLHDLRRTARTRFSTFSKDHELNERLLGHVPAGVRATYDCHAYRDEKRQVLQAWADALRSIVEKKPVLSAAA